MLLEPMISLAYHSHHMFPLAVEYHDMLRQAKVTPQLDEAKCAMHPSVYGRRIDASECLSSYWERNMTSTVELKTLSRGAELSAYK